MLLLMMGCLKITYTTGAPEMRPEDHSEWHSRFAYGTIEVPGPFEAEAVCEGEIAQVQTTISVTNHLATQGTAALGQELGVDTSGAYTPSTIRVWCE